MPLFQSLQEVIEKQEIRRYVIAAKDATHLFTFFPLKGSNHVNVYGQDITERVQKESLLLKSQEELVKQKRSLEKKNLTLAEVLELAHSERDRLRRGIGLNMEKVIYPLIDKIKLASEKVAYVDILKKSLKELTSPFGEFVSKQSLKLSPRELEISNLIKNSLSSKEIAGLLDITHKTVEKHRRNIRKKLGIAGKKINLHTIISRISTDY